MSFEFVTKLPTPTEIKEQYPVPEEIKTLKARTQRTNHEKNEQKHEPKERTTKRTTKSTNRRTNHEKNDQKHEPKERTTKRTTKRTNPEERTTKSTTEKHEPKSTNPAPMFQARLSKPQSTASAPNCFLAPQNAILPLS